jgi:hypothetical protein
LNKTNEIQIENPKDYELLGFISISIYWRDLLTDLLPPGSDGIVIVIENECNPSFSFQVTGPDVTYLGRGDLHDTEFDSMEVNVREPVRSFICMLGCVVAATRLSTKRFAFRMFQAWLLDLGSFSLERESYTGLPVVNDTCPYYLRLYPSKTMLNDYRSSDPILFTVCAALIFAFTSAVFLVYDRLVEKRQKTVMTTAVHTSAIVSSLFPSTVRERLFENDNDATGNEGPQPGESFVLLGDTVVSRPIADLYPSATVMFADM